MHNEIKERKQDTTFIPLCIVLTPIYIYIYIYQYRKRRCFRTIQIYYAKLILQMIIFCSQFV